MHDGSERRAAEAASLFRLWEVTRLTMATPQDERVSNRSGLPQALQQHCQTVRLRGTELGAPITSISREMLPAMPQQKCLLAEADSSRSRPPRYGPSFGR